MEQRRSEAEHVTNRVNLNAGFPWTLWPTPNKDAIIETVVRKPRDKLTSYRTRVEIA